MASCKLAKEEGRWFSTFVMKGSAARADPSTTSMTTRPAKGLMTCSNAASLCGALSHACKTVRSWAATGCFHKGVCSALAHATGQLTRRSGQSLLADAMAKGLCKSRLSKAVCVR